MPGPRLDPERAFGLAFSKDAVAVDNSETIFWVAVRGQIAYLVLVYKGRGISHNV